MRREQRSVLQTWVKAAFHLLSLAVGAVALSGESFAQPQDMPARWCASAASRGQEVPGVEPRPCVPFAQVFEEAKRKAREAERRDEEEMSAMRSLAGRALAGGNQQTQGAPRSEAQPVVAARTSGEPDSTDEDTDAELAEEAGSALPVHVAVEPPKRPPAVDLKQAEARKSCPSRRCPETETGGSGAKGRPTAKGRTATE